MLFSYIKCVIFFLYIIKNIFSSNIDINESFGKIMLNINKTFSISYNISIHPILNYPYLLKFNFCINHNNSNISFNDINDIHIYQNNGYSYHFLENEDSIINLILNKSIDSILDSNYIIFYSNNISKQIGESLSHQIFFISKENYISIINNMNKYYKNNTNSNISINIFYDNTENLLPYNYILHSSKIPLFSIIIILFLNKIFFNKNSYSNLCFNSSILRILYSIIYILIIKEQIKYNKNKFQYLSGLSIDSWIDSMNNFLNDIHLSFILTSIIFTINIDTSIINFFNSNDRNIKIYFILFLFLSLINIPNYLFNQNFDIALIDTIFLKIKKIIYEILKIILVIYFIKKQINLLAQILFFYSLYHLINNINFLIFKKTFYKIIRFIFFIVLFYTLYLNIIHFKKYKNNLFYWNIIGKCIEENLNSFIIFSFWVLLYLSEENNPILLMQLNKRKQKIGKYNIYKFESNNLLTKYNYHRNNSYLNISIYNKYPFLVLSPTMKNINNKNFDKISIGSID